MIDKTHMAPRSADREGIVPCYQKTSSIFRLFRLIFLLFSCYLVSSKLGNKNTIDVEILCSECAGDRKHAFAPVPAESSMDPQLRRSKTPHARPLLVAGFPTTRLASLGTVCLDVPLLECGQTSGRDMRA